MGSILRKDKIGALSESGGNIILGPSILTIGGQQYETTSPINVALPSLTANTRYQIFAVNNAGTIELRISQNENSQGPAGFNSWKLVGSFYADNDVSPGLGSFVNITGVPITQTITVNDASLLSGGASWNSVDGGWWRHGKRLYYVMNFNTSLTNVVSANELELSLPNNIPNIDGTLTKQLNGGNLGSVSMGNLNSASDWDNRGVFTFGGNKFRTLSRTGLGTLVEGQIELNTTFHWRVQDIFIQNWEDTPIEDL